MLASFIIAVVCQEIHCHLIGDNIVRAAMIASALSFQRCLNRLSFTGALQAIEEFALPFADTLAAILNSGNALLRTP